MRNLGLGQCVQVLQGLLLGHEGVVIGEQEIDGRRHLLVRVHNYVWYPEDHIRGLGAGRSIGEGLRALGRSVAALEASCDKDD